MVASQHLMATVIILLSLSTTCKCLSQSSKIAADPVHTLILCRHGASIWNGAEPGQFETFTGWTDVPLSGRGLAEAKLIGEQLSDYSFGIDCCFSSILGRAQLTAHHIMWAFAEKPSIMEPRRYVCDYRLNERHYGALQGFVKKDVEDGKYGHDPKQVYDWRRSWHAVPPLLEDEDPRRIEEVRKYQNHCGGPEAIPRGESLEMVANNRIRPFLDERVVPILEDAAKRNRESNDGSATGLIVAHANSIRALVGVICQVENLEKDPLALKRLEAMKIETGVPLVLSFSTSRDHKGNISYHVCDVPELELLVNFVPSTVENIKGHSASTLPVRPLSCIPSFTSDNKNFDARITGIELEKKGKILRSTRINQTHVNVTA